jgi:hypothetical protein
MHIAFARAFANSRIEVLINAKLMRAQKFYFEIARESKRDLKERRGGGWGTIYKQMGVFIEN